MSWPTAARLLQQANETLERRVRERTEELTRLNADLAAAFKLTGRGGSLVTDVVHGSPAFKAGLKPGDVITGIDDKRIVNSAQFHNAVGLVALGDQ